MLLRVAVVVEDVSRAVTHKCVMSRDFSTNVACLSSFHPNFSRLLRPLAPVAWLESLGLFCVWSLSLFWFTYHRSSIGSSLM